MNQDKIKSWAEVVGLLDALKLYLDECETE